MRAILLTLVTLCLPKLFSLAQFSPFYVHNVLVTVSILQTILYKHCVNCNLFYLCLNFKAEIPILEGNNLREGLPNTGTTAGVVTEK